MQIWNGFQVKEILVDPMKLLSPQLNRPRAAEASATEISLDKVKKKENTSACIWSEAFGRHWLVLDRQGGSCAYSHRQG